MEAALPRPELLGLDLQDAVGVDQKGHLDLGHPRRHRVDAGEIEAGERPIVLGQLPLSLEHVHVHCGLAVHRRREVLLGHGRNRRVARDQDADDAAQGLDARATAA